jgi:hypothetical protein
VASSESQKRVRPPNSAAAAAAPAAATSAHSGAAGGYSMRTPLFSHVKRGCCSAASHSPAGTSAAPARPAARRAPAREAKVTRGF